MSSLTIHSLFHYPVKSCSQVALTTGTLSHSGFLNDRRWMVVDQDTGKFITQRKYPLMCRIHTSLRETPEGTVLSLSYLSGDKNSSIDVPLSCSGLMSTEVWGDVQDAWDQGDQVATWLSELIGQSVRLVYIGDDQLRQVDQDYSNNPNDKVGFADGFPFLITTVASIKQFNQDLGYDIDVLRFRPNIVIDGEDLRAYEEDDWKGIRVNGIDFEFVKPCSRCVMPSINPVSLEKERAVITTLANTRRIENKTYFGQNAVHSRAEGSLSVGDVVELL